MSVVQGVKIPAAMLSAVLGDNYYNQGNATLRAWQALVQANVISMSLTSPPGSPSNGDTYIIGASPSGAWSGKAKNIAYWSADANVTAGWDFHAPVKGWLVSNQTDGLVYIYSGSAWVPLIPALPSDAKQFLDGTGAFSVPVPRSVAGINTQTASYTLVIGDAGYFVRMNSGSSNNLTVPANASVAFSIGTVVTVRQSGTGVTTIVADSGVTINSPSSLVIARQNGTVQLVKVGTDTWDLIGDVT